MMTSRRPLLLHPDCSCPSIDEIEVLAERTGGGGLRLDYRVTGAITELALPPPAPPQRADELWKHSCFEAFVRSPDADAYYELNFAPSGAWAAYRLEGYRRGMSNAAVTEPPVIEAAPDAASFGLSVVVTLAGLQDLDAETPWRLGLSAVIEEISGRKSYWALAHPAAKPDFHHRDCFTFDLPPA